MKRGNTNLLREKSLPIEEQIRIEKCRRYNKVDCCVYPEDKCKGCEYSMESKLFDGGCSLYYKKK